MDASNYHYPQYIQRLGYLDKIKPFINQRLIKIIMGQRRVGKSYLMFQIIDLIKQEQPKANIIYINKESFVFDNIKDYKDLINYVDINKQKKTTTYLFIDEIQDIVDFEKALRHLVLDEKMDIYCTGSNANLLSGELATYLSGRYVEFKLYSLSYTEFLNFHDYKNNTESLKKYLLWGGLPFIKNLIKSKY